MQTGYFNAAWQDIKNSPGWFGKLIVLSLVCLIPIFGWIVVAGYLYGWARDIAWNVHTPLPARVFGDEDGKLYSRGFFALVIGFICIIVPWVIEMVWFAVTGVGVGWSNYGWHGGAFAFLGMTSSLFSVLVFAITIFASLFSWVGSMRMSVYGRLAPGLQFGKVWAMMRHDFGGLMRIFGMALLLSIGLGIVVSILISVIVFIAVAVGFAAAGSGMGSSHAGGAMVAVALVGVVAVILFSVACGAVAMGVGVFISMMVVRALGYWTRQFDVPAWRGQDDPMPFEFYQAAGGPNGQPPMQR